MKILVIDDDNVFTEPLLWRLRTEGHEVSYYDSIEDVLNEKREFKLPKPDCLILDIMMPRGDIYTKSEAEEGKITGLKLFSDIQKKYNNIPTIILTVSANLNLFDLKQKYGENVQAILFKPCTPSEVINELKNFSATFKYGQSDEI